MRRITALVLVAAILCISCFTVSAAPQNTLIVTAEQTTVTTGDTVQVTLSFSRNIMTLTGLAVKLHYDSTQYSYIPGSAQSQLTMGQQTVTNNTQDAQNSYVLAFWAMAQEEDPAKNVGGTLLTLSFRCNAPEGSTHSFIAEVREAWDEQEKKIDIATDTNGAQVQVTGAVLTAGEKAAFEKLLDIRYGATEGAPDSKADIEAAKALFDSFDAAKKVNFKNANPDLFAAYQNAWSNYWKAAEAQSNAAIQTEVQTFLNAEGTQTVLGMKTDDVTAANGQLVKDVFKRYDALSDAAKTMLGGEMKTKLTALNKAATTALNNAEDAQIAEEALMDLLSRYSGIWDLTDDVVRDNYQSLSELIPGAKQEFAGLNLSAMSQEKQDLAAKYQGQLTQYEKIIEQTLADLAAEALIQEEMAGFNQRWSDILKLNALTTKISHEYAVEMMLEDYEKLSQQAKERLASHKSKGEQLLQMIAELKQSQQEPPAADTPGATNPPQNNQPGGNLPEEEPTVEVLPGDTTVYVRNIPLIVKIMLLVMFAGLLSLIFPACLYVTYRKKLKKGCERV